jgi:hypothetical protein
MKLAFASILFGLAGCAATVTASAPVAATVPLTQHEHSEQHEEHPTHGCATRAECDFPQTCCFNAPDGVKLTDGYCASVEMCEAVATPPR